MKLNYFYARQTILVKHKKGEHLFYSLDFPREFSFERNNYLIKTQFNIIPEYPQAEHISRNMQKPAMQKH